MVASEHGGHPATSRRPDTTDLLSQLAVTVHGRGPARVAKMASGTIARDSDASAMGQGDPPTRTEAPPCRLLDLPDSLLHHITRLAGRRCRTLCRALAAAYGPLKLELTDSTPPPTPSASPPATPPPPPSCLPRYLFFPPANPHVTHLALRRWPPSLLPFRSALLPAVAAKFPALTSATLPPLTSDNPLPPLAPLAPTLTALFLTLVPPHHTAPPPTIAPLSALTSLRALTVHYTTPPTAPTLLASWPPLLPHLRHLTRLHVSQGRHTLANPAAVGCSPWVIAVAAAAPQLVSLCINATPQGWGPETMAALRTLRRLRTVQVVLRTELEDDVRAFLAAWAAAPQLPRVTLVASVHVDSCTGGRALERLSQLQGVAHLEVAADDNNFIDAPGCARPEVQSIWHAVSPQPHLRRLTLQSPFTPLAPDLIHGLATLPLFTRTHTPHAPPPPHPLAALTIEAHSYDPPTLLPLLAHFPALQSLRLARWAADAPWPPVATPALALLTSLTSLDLTDCCFTPGTLRYISTLPRLRHLALCENASAVPRPTCPLAHPPPTPTPTPLSPAPATTAPAPAPLLPASHPAPPAAPPLTPTPPPRAAPPSTSPDAPPTTSELWHLAGLHQHLTHLTLDRVAAAFTDGLAVVPRLTALQHLTIACLPHALADPLPHPSHCPAAPPLLSRWHRLLLPLPPQLATLTLRMVTLTPEGHDEVAAACRQADCRLALDSIYVAGAQ